MEITLFGKQYFINKALMIGFSLFLIVGSGVLGYFLNKIYQPLSEPVIENSPASSSYSAGINNGFNNTDKNEDKEVAHIKVYVVGCVNKPGVVTLNKGDVIEDAIREAGGAAKDADLENINLAFELDKNTMLRIKAKPSGLQVKNAIASPVNEGSAQNNSNPKSNQKTPQMPSENAGQQAGSKTGHSSGSGAGVVGTAGKLNSGVDIISDSLGAVISDQQSATGEDKKSSLVNINTATQAELEELPNVGPATAKAIIEYREKNGKFSKVTDIMKITGIKQKTFDKIKDFICV